jgi:hypothetical protein
MMGMGMVDLSLLDGVRRNNGQQPELTITDPVKLERRLKRQRGEEGGADSMGSEEEAVGSNDGGRDAKRSRMVIDDDDDHDPLDIVGGTPSSQVVSHSVVRFAPNLVEPMGDLNAAAELSDTQPSQPQHSDDMVVDENPRRSGFDPSLLNPNVPYAVAYGYPSTWVIRSLPHLKGDPMMSSSNLPHLIH